MRHDLTAENLKGERCLYSRLNLTRFVPIREWNLLPAWRLIAMHLNQLNSTRANRRNRGFTLIEVAMGVAVLGVLFAALYAGMSFGFAEVNLSREEERATQILQEKMEVVRLLNWDQLVNLPGYVPASFTDSYYADNPTNTAAGGLIYYGTVLVTNPAISETYSNDLRLVRIQLQWTSGKVTHQRQMTTLVSQYGIQKYVY
jgi:prepilin-type N-terminal cleavage/methylation domain-containing protein